MDYREQALSYLRLHGPSTPTQIAKHISKDGMMAGAILSELSANTKVKISSIKVGSTPLYFLPGQEDQLQKFNMHLNEKELRAYALLQSSKVLRDMTCDALTQVCLRAIKDFAVPLQVTYENQQEIFWKWYLLSDDDATLEIKKLLEPPKVEKPQAERDDKKIKDEKKEEREEKREIKKEKIQPSHSIVQSTLQTQSQPTQQAQINDDFYSLIEHHCKEKNITIHSSFLVKKKKEVNLIISFTSALGEVKYFCKAKNKKKISPEDLSTAYLEAQDQKLPLVLLSSGELSPKAREFILASLKGVLFSQLS
ncbi:hypothetical protein J4457_04970 [Candidatus Woesearchaeota archaeon]|nr:hypothetical protein [Candidatus Woesearchaeota archaeon]